MLADDFFKPDCVVTGLSVQSKKRLLEFIADRFALSNPELDANSIFDRLIERERLGSTGLGKGIALPHARIDDLTEARAIFVSLNQPVDFDSIDNQPVDLVVALIVPSDANNEHLKILAGLAGFFINDDNCQTLRNSNDPQQVVDMLRESIESSLSAVS